ncbi:hypothetical protein, partial [Citrobacter sp. wls613]|uniref:hypothetical protein n=1 Tax=Citrobacter sp. wls613 TaxID=2576436 RepID=UPI001BAE6475
SGGQIHYATTVEQSHRAIKSDTSGQIHPRNRLKDISSVEGVNSLLDILISDSNRSLNRPV